MDAGARMNDLYRYQRHVYDLTRKTFLFGRDALLERMRLSHSDRVLEVGCGTARNLIKLHARDPSLRLFGLDASSEMLETARYNLKRHGLSSRACLLRQGLAQELSVESVFGVRALDAVFFSYSLSMIPDCTQSIDRALDSLSPGGRLYSVDFCDQGGFPPLLREPLRAWLGLFGVTHRPELYEHLAALAAQGRGKLSCEPFGARYGVWLEFTKR
jgi:S-adenosylmethionine-diacylgycerolhomoserine-N-methlytransferase